MIALTTSPAVHTLAWALVHSLWQGAALGVIVFLWLRVCRPTAQARYAGGIAALAALLMAPVATCLWLAAPSSDVRPAPIVRQADRPAVIADLATVPAAPLPSAPRLEVPEAGSQAAALAAVAIVAAWALGVLLLSLRLAGGWILARRIAARAATPAAADLCAIAVAVARRLGLTRAVRIVESTAVPGPMLVGWLRPVVLFPASALSGLSAGQVEALIAHELAHVRRHDYVLNILQSLVDTLLFYHPAVWFVSREVREAREQCCDDLAIGVCDRVVYASALADLAAISGTPRIALAATDGALLRRVRRLLGHPRGDDGPGVVWLGGLSLALVIGGVMPAALGSAGAERPDVQGVQAGVADGRAAEISASAGDGVVGGVGAGVAGGVVTGVEGGASAATVSGVSAGMPGGVAGGLSTAPGSDVTPRSQEERRQQEEEARWMRQAQLEEHARLQREQEARRQLEQRQTSSADLRELEARIAAMEQHIAAVLAQRSSGGTAGDVTAGSTARFAETLTRARAELDVARAEHERNQQLFASGRLSPSGLREAQERLAAAERELAAAAVELQATAEEATVRDTLDARRARLQSESRIRQAELELMAARESFDTIRQRFDVGTAGRDALAEVETRVALAAERLAAARAEFDIMQEEIALRQMRTAALRRLVSETEEQQPRQALKERDEVSSIVIDAAAQAQAGDILSIEIAGEPDIPRTYRVDQDGTIRLPLVGTIPVAGLTTEEVRDALTEALNQRRLAEGRSVTVALRRPQ